MTENDSYVKKALIALWPAAFLAIVTVAVFFTTLIIKERTFYAFPDNIDQFFAWYQKLAHAVHTGTLPLWDANVSAGHSFVGELQAGVFYPINLLWVWLFGTAQGITIFWLELIVVFHFWLAALGMYLAARSLGLRKLSSLATGLVFAFGGGLTTRAVGQTAIFFGVCYIPWAFFWFNRWLQSHKKLNLLWASLSLALIILAGHIDPWYFSCLLIGLFIIFQKPRLSFRSWFKATGWRLVALIIVMVGSIIIALPQIYISAQYLPKAVRFVGDSRPIGPGQKVSAVTFITKYTFQPQDSLSLVDPVRYPVSDGNTIYIGLIGLAIVITALAFCRRKLKEHPVWRLHGWFLIGATVIASFIMIGFWTFVPALLRYLPLFSQVRQLGRYSIIVEFCLAILVGLGIEVLAVEVPKLLKTKKQQLVAGLGVALVAGFLIINTLYLFVLSQRKGIIDKHFVYQNAILCLALVIGFWQRHRLQYVLLGAVVLSSITQPVWFMPKVRDFQKTYPPNYYQRTTVVNFLSQYYGRYRVLIENKALPINVGDVYDIQTINGYGATLHQPFFKFINEPDAPTQPGQHLNLLNDRFIVTNLIHPELKQVFKDPNSGIMVYERPDYVPRAYFSDQLQNCLTHQPSCTPINIDQYSDSDIKLHYQATKPEQLVLSEVNFTGWKALIDGQVTPIVSYGPTAVKLFRSVMVPAGSHSVEFSYQPFNL